MQRDNYDLPLKQVSFANNQQNTCYGRFCENCSHWNWIKVCETAPWFVLPHKTRMQGTIAFKIEYDVGNRSWQCLKFEVNLWNVVSELISKCPGLGTFAKFTHSWIWEHSSLKDRAISMKLAELIHYRISFIFIFKD